MNAKFPSIIRNNTNYKKNNIKVKSILNVKYRRYNLQNESIDGVSVGCNIS